MPIWEQLLIVFVCAVVGLVLLKLAVILIVKAKLVMISLYCLVIWISTFFTDYAKMHFSFVIIGFAILLALRLLSFIIPAIKNRREEQRLKTAISNQLLIAHRYNIPVGTVNISEDGIMMDSNTGKPIVSYVFEYFN